MGDVSSKERKAMPPCRQNCLGVFLEKTCGPIAWFYVSLSSIPPCCIWFPWNSEPLFIVLPKPSQSMRKATLPGPCSTWLFLVPSSESTAKPSLALESVTVFVAIRPVFSPHCFPKLCTSGKFTIPFFIVPSLTKQRAIIICFRLV